MPLKLCQKLLSNSVSEALRQPCSLKRKRLHACQIASEAEWLSSSWENNDCGRTSAAEWLSGLVCAAWGLSDLCVAGLHIRANGHALKEHVVGVRNSCVIYAARIIPESCPNHTRSKPPNLPAWTTALLVLAFSIVRSAARAKSSA